VVVGKKNAKLIAHDSATVPRTDSIPNQGNPYFSHDPAMMPADRFAD